MLLGLPSSGHIADFPNAFPPLKATAHTPGLLTLWQSLQGLGRLQRVQEKLGLGIHLGVQLQGGVKDRGGESGADREGAE